jgi:adenylate cyclase
MPARPPSLTLTRFFGVVFAVMALLIVGLVSLFYAGSRRTVLVASERLMAQASRHLVDLINRHLAEAEEAVISFERRSAAGLVEPGDAGALESTLLDALVANAHLTEVTFTRAGGQSSAFRLSAAEDAPIIVRRVFREGDRWWAQRRVIAAGARRPFLREPEPASDPTAHDTFTTPAEPRFRGRTLWSDLAYAQLDAGKPRAQQRRVVTVQKALASPAGRLIGVLRVGLLSDRVDELARLKVEEDNATDPHRVFVCDQHGRLVTRLDPTDTFAPLDEDGRVDPDSDDLRVVAAALPPGVRAALALPALRALEPGGSALRPLLAQGTRYLASFTALPEGRTQEWVVGVVVPEGHYLADLQAARRRLMALAGAILLAAAIGGGFALRAMRRALGRVVAETARMRGFDFTAAPSAGGPFRDVAEALGSLEQAKTALRAMTKYVPLDLVRQLYETRAEPTLGGHLQELSIMFTDIEGFTTVSERLPPDALATALGRYLEAMTTAIHGTGGIIDKYTGDGVMALWNAPRPCPGHARKACEAALACIEATGALFRSPAWAGLPAWRTRFGIHRAQVTVGHFGAPDRMAFTAMGDGVNLAARLEGLNKQYGTRILVSAAARQEAGDDFVFRRIDRVAVKGKHDGVEVYELLGHAGEGSVDPVVAKYEAALEAYFARRFAPALQILEGLAGDAPSAVLAARCRDLIAHPPASTSRKRNDVDPRDRSYPR